MQRMDDFDKKDEMEVQEREEIFSKVVRAGKRTYFFDVKATRKDDYYLTITESKKIFDKDGRFHFEKHKIFLYKEDFEKFEEGLAEVVGYIHDVKGMDSGEDTGYSRETGGSKFSDVEFEDLDGDN